MSKPHTITSAEGVEVDVADIALLDLSYAQSLSFEDVMNLAFDDVVEALDGCEIEPDGICPHGHRSPLLVLGFI